MISVLAGGELRNDEVVVFAFQRVEEPRFAFLDGAGEGKAWRPLIQGQSFLVLHGRNEVGGNEAVVIVADSGV